MPPDVRAVKKLESRQGAMPGPKWRVGNFAAEMAFQSQGPSGQVAAVLSGIEDGPRFASDNRGRY